MIKFNKYALIGTIFILSLFSSFYFIDVFSEKNMELQKQILIKQAQTHFKDQVNTRVWNASYGGVYAIPKEGQKPNPYLRDNILKVDENLTLIKINPAWMSRQLSEISNIDGFHFRITSLKLINPDNKATPFEERALKYFDETNEKEYYEIDKESNFNYMGALITTEYCLPCHKHQGYSLGDVRGGISVSLDSKEYFEVTSSIKTSIILLKIFVVIFLFTIFSLIFKQLRYNQQLQTEVKRRTKEIESTKHLLQEIIDTDSSFIVLTDDKEIIYANETILNFTGYHSIEEFKKNNEYIFDVFEKIEDNSNFMQTCNDGIHWIEYLIKEQNSKNLKVCIKKDGKYRYFKPYAKEIKTDDKVLYLITFDEITNEYVKIKELEHMASTDALTKLFNRTKLNDVLEKEMALSRTVPSPLSVIFLDIDYFKAVNDTYGHDAGDRVLINIANIITSSIRAGDIAARWGGEEFMIILQATPVSEASVLGEKLRARVEGHLFETVGKITISLGVTEYINAESEESFIKRVDEALYEAKERGRNKIIIK
ncbi:diguanylate cyclase (GGDEF domain) [Sulfurimonas denitrificans DSM 1251]|uniref:diguanylate cyclase n=1 Tax=Sulfurimonas denitrificans (strain ATCC 33889 / DSM 1251) TaxID=326298 RepID=Q30U30_SULDN|nr:diguanylate cyclase [Sulfurimonas denitrificans]ABB43501.1 diguanylate cyclase (GGDEF domain) [Sulfurimonas denitrificans DSM 1251]MDD3443659.1 diguanylate cyclase [Sulfurimonas denitrificans]